MTNTSLDQPLEINRKRNAEHDADALRRFLALLPPDDSIPERDAAILIDSLYMGAELVAKRHSIDRTSVWRCQRRHAELYATLQREAKLILEGLCEGTLYAILRDTFEFLGTHKSSSVSDASRKVQCATQLARILHDLRSNHVKKRAKSWSQLGQQAAETVLGDLESLGNGSAAKG